MQKFLGVWGAENAHKEPLRRVNPELVDTVSLARADGLIKEKGKASFTLSEKGDRFLALIGVDFELLKAEKKFLARIRPLTATGMWERLGAVHATSERAGDSA
ncbi:hypothetical protein [Streptomyces sp. NPDC059460]|uniref:hypothetical protein n=1 Tax=Streptomyces sp. NPDC059460 TaxID=3346840 RepID=UPI00368425D9